MLCAHHTQSTPKSHLKAFVSALSESNSTDSDVIPPAASLADAKNNILTDIDDGMIDQVASKDKR